MRTSVGMGLACWLLIVASAWAQLPNMRNVPSINGWTYYSSSTATEYEEVQNRFLLLRKPEVQAELGIDDQQRKQFDARLAEFQTAIQPLMPPRPMPGVPRQPEDRQRDAELQRQRMECQQQLCGQWLEVLYAEQRGRLEQLFLQHLGAKALLRSDVADQVKITHAQMDTLKALLSGPRPNPFEFGLAFNNPAQPRDIQAEMEKRRAEMEQRQARFETEAPQLLSAEQRAAYVQLLGKKFVFRDIPSPARMLNPPRIPPAPFLPES
jgi:hypothetical protein